MGKWVITNGAQSYTAGHIFGLTVYAKLTHSNASMDFSDELKPAALRFSSILCIFLTFTRPEWSPGVTFSRRLRR